MSQFNHTFLDHLEWIEDNADLLVYQYPMQNLEVIDGAKLIIKSGQSAIFVRQDELADFFCEPGHYSLSTLSLPQLAAVQPWAHSFKTELFFVKTAIVENLIWKIARPVQIEETDYNQVVIKAKGKFSFRITDPRTFYKKFYLEKQLSGVEQTARRLQNEIKSLFIPSVRDEKLSVYQIVENYQAVSQIVCQAVNRSFCQQGLELTTFSIEGLELDHDLTIEDDDLSVVEIYGDSTSYSNVHQAALTAEEQLKAQVDEDQTVDENQYVVTGMSATVVHNYQPYGGDSEGKVASESGSLYCPKCETHLAQDALYCSYCGTKAENSSSQTKFCLQCGSQNAYDALYCGQCGQKMG